MHIGIWLSLQFIFTLKIFLLVKLVENDTTNCFDFAENEGKMWIKGVRPGTSYSCLNPYLSRVGLIQHFDYVLFTEAAVVCRTTEL